MSCFCKSRCFTDFTPSRMSLRSLGGKMSEQVFVANILTCVDVSLSVQEIEEGRRADEQDDEDLTLWIQVRQSKRKHLGEARRRGEGRGKEGKDKKYMGCTTGMICEWRVNHCDRVQQITLNRKSESSKNF
eukprot:767220-Hanusia_phi.AAC.2